MLIVLSKEKTNSDNLIRSGIKEYAKIFNIELPLTYDIIREENKKPCLHPDFLKFNLSHSKDYTIIAISDKETGIDIQYHKDIDYKSIVERFFNVNQPIESLQKFYDVWSMKEAAVKKNGNYNLIKALKETTKNSSVSVLNVISDYSLAVDSEDKDYLLMFYFK